MVEKLQKSERQYKGLTKDRNNMRAVINTQAPSLGVERTKTIKDLKRQMILMEEENIKLFDEEEKYHISRKVPKKPWLCFK